MTWLGWALLSAAFAGLTAVLAKAGVRDVDSNLATAIRTSVVLVLAWGIALAGPRTVRFNRFAKCVAIPDVVRLGDRVLVAVLFSSFGAWQRIPGRARGQAQRCRGDGPGGAVFGGKTDGRALARRGAHRRGDGGDRTGVNFSRLRLSDAAKPQAAMSQITQQRIPRPSLDPRIPPAREIQNDQQRYPNQIDPP